MTTLFKPLNEKGETTFFTIFDVIYSDFIKKYGCGILSYDIHDSIHPNIKTLSFYGDGLLHCRFLANVPVGEIGSIYGILFWEGVEYYLGQEPFTLTELKQLVFGNPPEKFKILKAVANPPSSLKKRNKTKT